MNTTEKQDWQTKLAQVRAFGTEQPVDTIAEEIEDILKSIESADSAEVVSEETVDLDKLLERNMLGRLAKSLELNEDCKQKLFNYFEKGELEQ